MKFIKCYYKIFALLMHIAIIAILCVAISHSFTRQLFVSDELTLNTYEIFAKKDLSFSYLGIINFSKDFIYNSNFNANFDSFFKASESMLNASIAMKFSIFALLALHVILIIIQLFDCRIYATFINIAISLLLILLIRMIGLHYFSEIKLITSVSSSYTIISILWAVAFIISAFQSLMKYKVNHYK